MLNGFWNRIIECQVFKLESIKNFAHLSIHTDRRWKEKKRDIDKRIHVNRNENRTNHKKDYNLLEHEDKDKKTDT